MLNSFDTAILDRVQLKLWYDDLNLAVRKIIYHHFFDVTNADIYERELSKFIKMHLNN